MTTVALSPGTAGLECWNEQGGKAGSTIETALPGSASTAASRVTTTSVARGPVGPIGPVSPISPVGLIEKPEKPLEKAATSGEKSGGVTAGVPNEEQDPVIVSGEDAEDVSQRGVQGTLESPESLEGQRIQEGQRSQEGQIDDHALLAATRAGDETAFQEIVRRYRNQITNYVYRMTSDYDRAVDIAQETFVRVYMNIDREDMVTIEFPTEFSPGRTEEMHHSVAVLYDKKNGVPDRMSMMQKNLFDTSQELITYFHLHKKHSNDSSHEELENETVVE